MLYQMDWFWTRTGKKCLRDLVTQWILLKPWKNLDLMQQDGT